jgi:hypothetical protein
VQNRGIVPHQARRIVVSTLVANRNVQVSADTGPENARSESAIAVNPRNPQHFVGASKRFRDIANYKFSIATYASFNGGSSWTEGTPPIPEGSGWDGISDPAVAFDGAGNPYLAGLPYRINSPMSFETFGIAMYTSPDGGLTWSAPELIHAARDDKQTLCADTTHGSPWYGTLYAAWDAGGGGMGFARKSPGGSWTGSRGNATPNVLPGTTDSFSPEIAITADGTVYIVWFSEPDSAIKFVKSSDGGDTFTAGIAASGISPLSEGPLQGASFRVGCIPCASPGRNGTVVAVWADSREGRSRIYMARTADGGLTWSPSRPLLPPGAALANQDDFHPQIDSWQGGGIACSFYRYGPKPPTWAWLIDVITVVSQDDGVSFSEQVVTTETPWDPTRDAPFADANPNVTFIGDYFGLVATPYGWQPFWTDTRTGNQEIFTTSVHYEQLVARLRDDRPPPYFIVMPDPGPELGMAIYRLAERMPPGPSRATIQREALRYTQGELTQLLAIAGEPDK